MKEYNAADFAALRSRVRTTLGTALDHSRPPLPADEPQWSPAIGDDPSGVLRRINHTNLKPEAMPEQIVALCVEAAEYGFAAVCINSVYVPLAYSQLQNVDVRIAAVVGFPLGATAAEPKAAEAAWAVAQGANEIDTVLPFGLLKGGHYAAVRDDLDAVVTACHVGGARCKVIIEAVALTDEEKIAACLLAVAAGADSVKTSTGFGPGGATVGDVRLIRLVVGDALGVEASGGISAFTDARNMLRAGATRLGSSAGVAIAKEAGLARRI